MSESRFSDQPISAILHECGGMDVFDTKLWKALNVEDRNLKKLLAEQVMDNATLKKSESLLTQAG